MRHSRAGARHYGLDRQAALRKPVGRDNASGKRSASRRLSGERSPCRCGRGRGRNEPARRAVSAAAVILKPGTRIIGIDDLKKLDAAARKELAKEIKEKAASWNVAFVEVEEIDFINIYWAGLQAMQRAVQGLGSTPAAFADRREAVEGDSHPPAGDHQRRRQICQHRSRFHPCGSRARCGDADTRRASPRLWLRRAQGLPGAGARRGACQAWRMRGPSTIVGARTSASRLTALSPWPSASERAAG